MAYEIELKARIDSIEAMHKKLTSKGCTWTKTVKQHDAAFRKIEETDSGELRELLFRIRKEESSVVLTFKKVISQVEVIELDSPVGNPDSIAAMLQMIGFDKYAIVNKTRTEGCLDGFYVCLDEVDRLGCFLEVEILAENFDRRSEAKESLYSFLTSLGIGSEYICNKRYHTMIHELKEEN